MPSLKALRARIKSVKNTRQITKTMKMVAAAKVRKARTAVEGARPYAAKLAEVMTGAATGSSASPLMSGRPKVKNVLLVLVGTDRGLCGGLNTNLIKQAEKMIAGHKAQGRGVKLVAVGRKMRDAFKNKTTAETIHTFTEMGRVVEFAHAQTIAAFAKEQFEDGTVDEVHLLFAECVSMLTQSPKAHQLIPFAQSSEASASPSSTEYEPSAEAVLTQLLPLNLNMQVFTALLETQASEHAARMSAMDNATRNAGEMIDKLTVTYNRSRQAAITTELIEIIAGAEAI
ncbi:MAG: ATP synthase F1 subunit gamma [Alphaproteobacteria bacterium CG_4_10_14_0_8_um_filter_53_9]|nr:MAG: ATP synthase F1 subunit gamma [Alphaproteobacteria bacterium CG_4_10_14_0_8_um_filter_53_9]